MDVQRVRFIVLITKYNRVIFPEAVKHRLSGPVSGSLNLLLETVRLGYSGRGSHSMGGGYCLRRIGGDRAKDCPIKPLGPNCHDPLTVTSYV